jgi:hypothetical protein
MRFNELNEEGFIDAGERGVQAFSNLAKHAATAFGKLKNAKDKAKSSIEADIDKAESEAEKAAAKSARETEKAKKATEKASKKKKQPIADMPALIAKVVLDRTPQDPEDIEEFHSLDPETLSTVSGEIDKIKERLSKLPRELRKALKASDFLQDQHRTDVELNDMLGEQPDAGMEPAENMLMKNLFSEQDVWTEALTSDDDSTGQQMVSLIKAISRDFERRNLANISAKKKKNYPEGTGIVRIISTQRQLIAMRLTMLKDSVEKLAHKPVTEASLRRVRKLLEHW